MTLENNFEIKRHLVVRKIQGLEFIILLRYIAPELTMTIITVPLKDGNNKNLQVISSKQSCKSTRL